MGYRPACWRQGVQKPFQPATGQKAANSALGHEILKLFGTETQAVQYELLICLQKAAERPCIDATQSALCGRLCLSFAKTPSGGAVAVLERIEGCGTDVVVHALLAWCS